MFYFVGNNFASPNLHGLREREREGNMDEIKLLGATLQDKYQQFVDYYTMIATDFLTLDQQPMARKFLQEHRDVTGFLYGGVADAERCRLIFVPDYLEIKDEMDLHEYFCRNPEECPLSLLNLTYSVKGQARKPGHRDFLGSLLGEGIKREKIGDIIVYDGGAQVVVSKDIAAYLETHYGKAGRVNLEVQVLPISEANYTAPAKETVSLTVSSARLDNVIAAVFGLSRKNAVLAINQGKVFVNGLEVCKVDFQLKGGEKLVLRGKGKAIYKGSSGSSKKGKLYITAEKYI